MSTQAFSLYVSHLAFTCGEEGKSSSFHTIVCQVQSLCKLGRDRDAPSTFTWEKAFNIVEDLQLFELCAFTYQEPQKVFKQYSVPYRKTVTKRASQTSVGHFRNLFQQNREIHKSIKYYHQLWRDNEQIRSI